MPFYEYECSACKFYVEALQKISDPPLKKCPSCGKETMQRLISAPVFRLKGSGWYETDFKSDKENKRNLVGDGDKEPAASADSDDKKVKVRASKALKKVAAKKTTKKAGKKVGKVGKSSAKSAKKVVKRAAAKPAPAKKKAAKKAKKKPVSKAAARKK